MSSDFDPEEGFDWEERLKSDRKLQRAVSALIENAKLLKKAGFSPEHILLMPEIFLDCVKIRRP